MIKANFLNIIFYIVAHADDWQLFMNPEAYNDLISQKNKVIFIITTAGDAGKSEVFWRAREEGMKSSILYCLDRKQPIHFTEGYKIIMKQPIAFWSVNSTKTYFLRLPDGGVTGAGFKENECHNLKKLEDGTIPSLSSLDGSFTLFSWESFCAILKNIINAEYELCPGKIVIKFLDPDA